MNEHYSALPRGVRRQARTSRAGKMLLAVVGGVLACLVSTARAENPRAPGVHLPAGVADPRPCPDGTIRVVEFAGPCYEQLCLKSDLLGTPIIHGSAMAWYKNKQPYLEGAYLEGKPHGAWTFWHENGQKERQGVYRDGQPEGRWTLWDPEGRAVEVEFHHGEAVRFSPSREAALSVKGFASQDEGGEDPAPLLHWGNEIHGQVVDAVTRQPIAGAVVVAIWEVHVERRVNPGTLAYTSVRPAPMRRAATSFPRGVRSCVRP